MRDATVVGTAEVVGIKTGDKVNVGAFKVGTLGYCVGFKLKKCGGR